MCQPERYSENLFNLLDLEAICMVLREKSIGIYSLFVSSPLFSKIFPS